MRRIDVLPRRYSGIEQLRGAVLADDLDPELQAITEQASRELAAPMATVSLMLENIQFFRAQHGLPQPLEAARATDRDVSFCQYVVRDAAVFEINDAAADPRIPQELVERFGIAAYLGAPLVLGGETVGSMCVIDRTPRAFTAHERATLMRMAAAASQRLAVLAAQPRDRERVHHERVVRPAFGELRNRLTPVLGNISLLQVSITELTCAQRLAQHAVATRDVSQLDMLARTASSLAEVQTSLDELVADTQAIAKAIVALERASTASTNGCALEDVVDTALTLSHHRTKLAGGVRRPARTTAMLDTARPVAISAVSAALSGVSDQLATTRSPRGIDISITADDAVARIQLRASLDAVSLSVAAVHLRLLLDETSGIELSIDSGVIELVFPLRRVTTGKMASLRASANVT